MAAAGCCNGLASEYYKADPAHVRTGYIGSLAARSALYAIPAEQLSSAEPTDDTVALFARRIRLTRLMLDVAREIGQTRCRALGSRSG